MMPQMPASLEDTISQTNYLIGWICILPSEYYEAVKMFDEKYDSAYIVRGHDDRNDYDIGRIGNHLVVMNCPAAGTCGEIRAAKIASDMRSSFPAIRFMLLVGIGGGSPSRQDVRLGDVVLGSKVLPYKEGKETDHGFEITGQSAYPPLILQSAMTRLGSKLRGGLNLQETIQNIGIQRPEKDNLYLSNYVHDTCCDCLEAEPQALSMCNRSLRRDGFVQVHEGVVGSADQVMKNANKRDYYAEHYKVICYEMEAVGVMRTISCLTVRGISDYSDGHKNDDWHSYASLSAAVCTKELLSTINVSSLSQFPLEVTQVVIERWVREAIRQFNHFIHQPPEPQSAYQTAERSLTTIVDQYSLVQELIVPQLYELVDQTDSEKDQELHNSVYSLKTLQKELRKCLNTLHSRASKQAKRRDNSEAMREQWKLLKNGIAEQMLMANEISNTTQQILGHGHRILRHTPRIFFTGVGKGNQAIHDASKYLRRAAHKDLEYLKLLMKQFASRFRVNRKDNAISHPENDQNGTPLESITNCEDDISYSESPPAQKPSAMPPFSERDHFDVLENQDPVQRTLPSSPGSDHSSSGPVPNTFTIQSPPSTRTPSPVPEKKDPPPIARKNTYLRGLNRKHLASPSSARVLSPQSREFEDANSSSPSFSVTPRQSAEHINGTLQQDHTLPSYRHLIQPSPARGPVTGRESGSSTIYPPPPMLPPVEPLDSSPSRTVHDLVTKYQTTGVLIGIPPPSQSQVSF